MEFSAERGTKTRTGETIESTNADARSFKPKMWATPENPDMCPVALFKKFFRHRPAKMCTSDSPFYLAINHKRAEYSLWYKKQPLGVNHIDKMIKSVVAGTSITGRKTNHSARKTMVETLCRSNVPDSTTVYPRGCLGVPRRPTSTHIVRIKWLFCVYYTFFRTPSSSRLGQTVDSTVMQLSGHQSVQSVNHYKKLSLDQQRSMSHLLSSHSSVASEPSPVSLTNGTSTAGLSGDTPQPL